MLTLAVLACFPLGSGTTETAPSAAITRIACVGDAITAGEGLGRSERHAWPAQLRQRLNVDLGYEAFPIDLCDVRQGTLVRTGESPMTRAAEFERLVTRVDYEHVVVMLGTNDAIAAARQDESTTLDCGADLAAIVERLRERRTDARILFVGPPPIFPNAWGVTPDRRALLTGAVQHVRALQEQTRAFAARHPGITYCDLNGIVHANHVQDGVHPDPFGHEAIARAVHGALAPELGLSFDERAAIVPAPSAEYRAGAGWNGGTWWDAFERLRRLGRENAGVPVVFFGDSITQGLTGDGDRVVRPGGDRAVDRFFGEDGALVLGLSGDRTEHLRFRARKGALRWMSPRVIVLQIGINNLKTGGHPPEDVASGIRAVTGDLRAAQPWSTILVCGPFPAGRDAADPLRRAVDAVHAGIASIGDGTESEVMGGREQVRYLDLREMFLGADGAPGPGMAGDALHVNEAGRELWMKAIEPSVRAELDRPLVPDLPAELAWLVDNDDYPRVSRALVTLAPGASGPRRRAQPILYSFDAFDWSCHAGAADGTWVFTGPILERRPTPNVGLPLHALTREGQLESWPIEARFVAVGPKGRRVAIARIGSVSIVDLTTGEHAELLDAATLGRTMPKEIGWRQDGRLRLELGSVAGGRGGEMTPGTWAVHPVTGARERVARLVGEEEKSGEVERAILAEPLKRHLGTGRSFEDVQVRNGWVVACRIESDGSRTVHLFRLDSGEHYLLGKGMRPRWGFEPGS